MKFCLAIVSAAVVSIASCGSAEVKNPRHENQISVVHSVEYSHKGTKSESRSGILTIDGTVLPRCFSAVSAGGKRYVMKTRSQRWGSEGYFPDEENSAAAFSRDKMSVNSSDIARGWYEPASEEGLPSGWILVRWDGGSAAVLPSKVQDLVAAKNLKPIAGKDLRAEKTLKK